MQKEPMGFHNTAGFVEEPPEGYYHGAGYGTPAHECLQGFKERMRNLAPFACVVKKLGNLQKYPDIDTFSLGIGVMLFILENMLIGHEECSMEEISEFLQEQIYRTHNRHITQEDARELAFYIRDAITGNGEPYVFSYMNLETARQEEVPIRLVDVSYYEIKKTSRYKLTDQGMELLFKTREIYSEFRLNVTQLYLKQQIEKGVFAGALQTVNELGLQVRQLRERIDSLLEGIRQNVLNVDFEGLKSLLTRIQEQFVVERREFNNIKYILREQKRTLEDVDLNRITDRNRKALVQIRALGEKLTMVSAEHDRLFNEKLDILGEYVKMLEFRMKAGMTEYLDFERNLLDRLGKENLSHEAAGFILSPLFINHSRGKVFNIFKAAEPQSVRSGDSDEAESVDVGKLVEEKERQLAEQAAKRNEKIERYIEILLNILLEHSEVTLAEFMKAMPKEVYRQAAIDFDFFSLVMMLHQRRDFHPAELAGIGRNLVYDTAYNIDPDFIIGRVTQQHEQFQSLGRIEVLPGTKEIVLENGNRISEFVFRRA